MQSSHIKEIVLSSPRTSSSQKQSNNIKEIDLSSGKLVQGSKSSCNGCGIENAPLRCVTQEFLCPSCRTDINFKLITKSTALQLYPALDFSDLIEGYKKNDIQCFFIKNWHNHDAAPIKLYYEKEIQQLEKRKKRGDLNYIRQRSSSRSKKSTSRQKKYKSSSSSSSSSKYHHSHKRRKH
jgi:hypothetical protein